MNKQLVPKLNTNDNQIEIVAWHVQSGERVEVGQDLVDLGTSKAVVTVQADAEGYVQIHGSKGDVLAVGSVLAAFFPDAKAVGSAQLGHVSSNEKSMVPLPSRSVPAPALASTGPLETYNFSKFSPAAEKFLQASKLDRSQFNGMGLVTVDIIKEKIGLKKSKTSAPSIAAAVPAPLTGAHRSDRVGLSKMAEIQSLTTGQSGLINSSLTVYFDSANVRRRLESDGNLGGFLLPIILYEMSSLLAARPEFTSYYEDGQIHFYDRVDLGVAVDLGKGLKVISLSNTAEALPADYADRLTQIGERYLANRLSLDELQGSTFTVTDLSASDILHFQPLINGRQAAILGIGGDSTLPGHPMTLTLTFDHRILTGREAGAFLTELKNRILSYSLKVPNPEAGQTLGPEPVKCDRCSIELTAYHQKYQDEALMQLFIRPDGKVASICHVCAVCR